MAENAIMKFFREVIGVQQPQQPEAPAPWIQPVAQADIDAVSADADTKVGLALNGPDPWDADPTLPRAVVAQRVQLLTPALAAVYGAAGDGPAHASSMAAFLAILVPQDMVEELHGALTGPPPEPEPPIGPGSNHQQECKLLMASPRYGPVFQAFVNSEHSGENVAFVRAAKALLRDFKALETGLEALRERAIGAVGRDRSGAIPEPQNRPDLDSRGILTRAQAAAQALNLQFIAEHSPNEINLPHDSRQAWAVALPVFAQAGLPDPNQEADILNVANLLSPETMKAMTEVLESPIEDITGLVAKDSFGRFRLTPVYKAIYPRLMAEAGQ